MGQVLGERGERSGEAPTGETDVTPPADEETPASEPESDQDDTEEGEATETTPDEDEAAEGESEPQTGLSEKEVERLHKKLDAETTRHSNRVSEIMGEAAQDLIPCPLCLPNIRGFILPVTPPPDIVANVKQALGEPVEPDYPPAANAQRCQDCDGWGKRFSGSRVSSQRVLLCDRCKGNGWIAKPGSVVYEVPTASNGGEAEGPQVPGEDLPEQDPWGRTPDDADYGRMPMYVK